MWTPAQIARRIVEHLVAQTSAGPAPATAIRTAGGGMDALIHSIAERGDGRVFELRPVRDGGHVDFFPTYLAGRMSVSRSLLVSCGSTPCVAARKVWMLAAPLSGAS